ncbi:uncharacterized protein LOC124342251 [Daphnia pulicaria]|uniref:uncharacterized protein LOC124342251 n=1 Tax=Daphnia pulicaria TaxID=35523 RepID=UPI001EEC513D|nr:uncharacterized protein LOC124342251 [Daphnia pulicaria]
MSHAYIFNCILVHNIWAFNGIGVITSHGWGPQREALLTIAAGIVLNDPHQNGRGGRALVARAGAHPGGGIRGLGAAVGANAAQAQGAAAHIVNPADGGLGAPDHVAAAGDQAVGARPEIPINAADGGLGAPDIVAAAGDQAVWCPS